MSGNKIIICGLPGSGKTTFLGALSYIIESNEVNTELKCDGIADNIAYLNKLASRWLECQQMDRTPLESSESIELNLISSDGKLSLQIPDYSGETWSNLWGERQCKEHVKNIIIEADSILFFIHSNEIKKPISIMDVVKQQEIIGDKAPLSQGETWLPNKHSSTQSVVIDLLQIISSLNKRNTPKKLAIILSAWDKTADLNCTPENFIENNMTMLYQYLKSGFDYPEWDIYGVSAQGGDLNTDYEKLEAYDEPSKRVIIVGRKDFKHDLSMPIKQLLRS